VIEIVKRRVAGRNHRRQKGHEEVLVVIRGRVRDNNRRVVKTDDYLSNASADVELAEFARAAKAEHRIEECIPRAKSEAGLADYEVRQEVQPPPEFLVLTRHGVAYKPPSSGGGTRTPDTRIMIPLL
jgi:hypothetical protein